MLKSRSIFLVMLPASSLYGVGRSVTCSSSAVYNGKVSVVSLFLCFAVAATVVVVADGSSCVFGVSLLLRLCNPGVVGACVVLSVLSVVDVSDAMAGSIVCVVLRLRVVAGGLISQLSMFPCVFPLYCSGLPW